MHIDELKTFLTVVEEKNFTKASEVLSLSQPTVSVHIKNLEKEFLAPLFQRTTKSLMLTREGEVFLDHARQLMSTYNRMKEAVYTMHEEVSGTIHIGASFTIGEYVLPELMARMQEEYEEIHFEVTIANTEEIIQLVRALKVDIGLVEGHSGAADITLTPFQADRLGVVKNTSTPFYPVTLEALQDQKWVVREKGSGTRESFDYVMNVNGIRVRSLLVISSTQGVKEAVKNGLGLSLLSEAAISEEQKHNTLELLSIEGIDASRFFSYVLPKRAARTKNVQFVIRSLTEN
ncbi:LysR family transcriptional regulator [Marinococcus halophilus]|uniref:HTH-type transcriptional regulator CysL n=1 Tax=Marinococcus halophilus TaxID=1371 RepID=A0A510Y880_MARHA|nr:LysR family transcriptional regulator [Marinococcus halophilus]OZT79352.1 LysR family transcriptional regulator [Marinococcus halophilus]GEK59598.1 HTH-type transcriptional regulator CysL [Marinococcus halophilus]